MTTTNTETKPFFWSKVKKAAAFVLSPVVRLFLYVDKELKASFREDEPDLSPLKRYGRPVARIAVRVAAIFFSVSFINMATGLPVSTGLAVFLSFIIILWLKAYALLADFIVSEMRVFG